MTWYIYVVYVPKNFLSISYAFGPPTCGLWLLLWKSYIFIQNCDDNTKHKLVKNMCGFSSIRKPSTLLAFPSDLQID